MSVPNSIQIPLTKGMYAIIDKEDYNLVSKYKWRVSSIQNKRFYASTEIYRREKSIHLLMHRFIMDAPKGMHVDHINHNTLDNRRSNLRICTRSQNYMNRLPYHGKSSIYKGVSWLSTKNRWEASIKRDGKNIYLGRFMDEKEAAFAYDVAAMELFGEFAFLNNPYPTSQGKE